MKFNVQAIIKITGVITVIIALSIIPPFFVSLAYHEGAMQRGFLLTIAPLLAVGGALAFLTKPISTVIHMREGVFIVAECWLLASLLGAAPYLLSGASDSFIDAFFESASAFSTTGATLIPDLASLPKSLLFWRSLTHWLGGMGILVFAISILPALGIGALRIARAETPGPTLDKVSSRISDSAKLLYIIYMSLSVVEFAMLAAGGMTPYEAAVHALASMGTGGLSSCSAGISSFDSLYVELVVGLFTVLASVNFINYNELLRRRWKEALKDSELRVFLAAIALFTLLFGLLLAPTGLYSSVPECFRQGFNQTVAMITTSGYVTTDYTLWPKIAKWLLFSLLLVGGCSSSTAGGLKVVRVMVMLKVVGRNFYKRLHPRAVVPVKIGDKTYSAETVSGITAFILTYFAVLLICSLLLSLDGHSLSTTVSAAAAALSNNSIAFGELGFGSTYQIFSAPARLLLSLAMIAGRLELFTVIILLTPTYWRTERR
ncbi:MAG: TrkH family potassium uptake protein [Clostridiales Family XIII bacterium]|jgi:trk system potassium uptake protein TrkH|nr:TrkH family potassium uptake protein [Clostridiales Family XIII bacterium]